MSHGYRIINYNVIFNDCHCISLVCERILKGLKKKRTTNLLRHSIKWHSNGHSIKCYGLIYRWFYTLFFINLVALHLERITF